MLDRTWRAELAAARVVPESETALKVGDTLPVEGAEALVQKIGESGNAPYSISVEGGGLSAETATGRLHRSNLSDGPIDWWPSTVRRLVWQRLGLDAPYQWLLLGVGVGLVMGGSQALARSLFAQIVPHTRSGEFFSFFGFMGRVSTVFGPLLYVVVTGLIDTRVAILSIMGLIVAGGVLLHWVDVRSGARAADEEDARHYAEAGEAFPT